MKISNGVVSQFEDEQKEYGTKVAIHNLLWACAAELLNDIGCKRVTTSGSPSVRNWASRKNPRLRELARKK